jgi:hypothetical protein
LAIASLSNIIHLAEVSYMDSWAAYYWISLLAAAHAKVALDMLQITIYRYEAPSRRCKIQKFELILVAIQVTPHMN